MWLASSLSRYWKFYRRLPLFQCILCHPLRWQRTLSVFKYTNPQNVPSFILWLVIDFASQIYASLCRTTQDKRHVLALLIPTWSVSFAISLPLIIQGYTNTDHVMLLVPDVGLQCGIFDHVFAIYSSMVSFFLPLAIMIFADIRSVQILRKNSQVAMVPRNRGLNRSRSRSPSSKDTSAYELAESEGNNSSIVQSPMIEFKVANSTIPEGNDLISSHTTPFSTPRSETSCSVKSYRSRSKSVSYIGMLAARGVSKLNSRERRAEKTLIWVFVCFVALWMPFFFTNFTYGVCGTKCDIPSDIFLVFTWLGYISSGVNPCIYTCLNKDFRFAFKKLLTCRISHLNRKT